MALAPDNRFTYVNVLPPGSDTVLCIGSLNFIGSLNGRAVTSA